MAKPKKIRAQKEAANYSYPQANMAVRPEIGTQAQFKKHKAPQTYRYDSSLSPALDWDAQNPAREQGEALIAEIMAQAAVLERDVHVASTSNEKKPHESSGAKGESTLKRPEGRAPVAAILDAAQKLKSLSKPFLNWTGKAEHLSFDVPTLPLFVHERLSTRAIIETLTQHKRDQNLDFFSQLYGNPSRPIVDQALRAYEHTDKFRDKWENRMILGDSLVVMNSLLRYESLGAQVQMIYIDPPYGVKFGSNFQPFVRKRDVGHGDDDNMTREPEMVQAYRDTWELGLHSYLTYLRDRLLLAREMLTPSGSVFVQISDENLHHVRELMDEVFGAENFCSVIPFAKTASTATNLLNEEFDYLLWYAKDITRVKYTQLFQPKLATTFSSYKYLVNSATLEIRPLRREERDDSRAIPDGFKIAQLSFAVSQDPGKPEERYYAFKGVKYDCGASRHWKTINPAGLDRLAAANRLVGLGTQLNFIRYLDDFPATPLSNAWTDTGSAGFSSSDPKIYVVQTDAEVIQRCLLMTTDPGDLVIDPTCGSGTTAFVAEQWGRRWITCDTSRVPLALARQRLLTATFPFYEIRNSNFSLTPGFNPVSTSDQNAPAVLTASSARGKTAEAVEDSSRASSTGLKPGVNETGALPNNPSAGFIYKRKQNQKGEEVGGIVPHVTLKSIANNEPPGEEVLVDRPEELKSITRVCGPFVFEATIPTAHGLDAEPETPGIQSADYENFTARMLEVLRKSPVLRLDGNRTVTFKNIRPPAKTLCLSAEALQIGSGTGVSPVRTETHGRDARATTNEEGKPVAFVFGPENGAVSERLVAESAREAWGKNYSRLYVIGFAIEAKARETVDNCEAVFNVPATYVQATPDLLMGDLLKNMRSSQIFSVCGSPEIVIRPVGDDVRPGKDQSLLTSAPTSYEVELLGLDVFDPITMEVQHRMGGDVPAWFLDADYNGMVFHVSQAFFPRTGAWESLKKALKGDYDESVWDHLSGTVSAPFTPGKNKEIAVKVIDDRGNELLVVKKLEGGK